MKRNEVWKASTAYTLAKAQKAGEDARSIAIGYLLTLSKADPKCSRRDSRRQGLPLATAIHGVVWTACCNRSAALPNDTARGEWETAVKKIYEIALAAYADKAKKAKADRDKPDTDKPDTDKPDTDKPDTDKPDTDKPATDKPATDKPAMNPVTAATAALIAAIAGLPVEQRAIAARKACQEVSAKFE